MTLSALHRKLTEEGLITSSRQYLGRLATEGKLPYTLNKKNKKVFDYKTVVDSFGNYTQKPEQSANAKPTLHTLPTPKAGQSKAEYQDEVMELGLKPTLAESKTFLTIYQGKISQQKFDIEAEKLVYREEVEQKAFKVARVIRDQLLTLPERLSGEMASSTDPKEIKEIMYKEINQVLTFLHEGEALYD